MHDPGRYARSFADVYDDWYGDLHDTDAIANAFASRVSTAATILELGSGTGRLTAPLVAAGYVVVALDASIEMLVADAEASHRVAADMAAIPLSNDSVDGTLIAFNTLFNLTEVAQRACLRELARVMRPGGWCAIEGFIAGDQSGTGVSVRAHPTDPVGRLVIITAAVDDLIDGVHVELRPTGATLRPWQLHYRSPAQLDALAASAGLTLAARHADWAGDRLEADATRHVSWYRRR